MNAFHEGGHIIIQISDDGRGLNMDRIRNKCIENGVASEMELEGLTDQQIQQFIFKAGFSTAEKVTSVSGRGVGMDCPADQCARTGARLQQEQVRTADRDDRQFAGDAITRSSVAAGVVAKSFGT